MYTALMVVHIVICLFLIAVILLQAGRGGGFSEMAAGGQMQNMLGTQSNAFLTRVTEVAAVLFIVTSLSLGIMSTQRGKSLVERNKSLIQSKASSLVLPAKAEKSVNAAQAESEELIVPVKAEAEQAAAVVANEAKEAAAK